MASVLILGIIAESANWSPPPPRPLLAAGRSALVRRAPHAGLDALERDLQHAWGDAGILIAALATWWCPRRHRRWRRSSSSPRSSPASSAPPVAAAWSTGPGRTSRSSTGACPSGVPFRARGRHVLPLRHHRDPRHRARPRLVAMALPRPPDRHARSRGLVPHLPGRAPPTDVLGRLLFAALWLTATTVLIRSSAPRQARPPTAAAASDRILAAGEQGRGAPQLPQPSQGAP